MMKDKKQELLQSVFLPIEKLENNTGQLEGIPANPRKITDADVKQLRKSIEETPEMLNARELLVVPNGDTWVAIGGNQRLRALRALGYEKAVCKIIPENYDRLAIAIKDNTEAGEWDYGMLAEDWDKEKLADWGVVPMMEEEPQAEEAGQKEENQSKTLEDLPPMAKNLVDKAMQQYCGEFAEQLEYMMSRGWIVSGLSVGYAKIMFLLAKYLGKSYPRKLSFIFNPDQIKTAAGAGKSYFDQLLESAKNGAAGIAGFENISIKSKATLTNLLQVQYPIGGAKGVHDFPVDYARELIARYGKGGDILDPCHGWGGRLTAAMLQNVRSYTGIDPSPVANRGALLISEAFKEYADTKVEIIKSPFEKVNLPAETFDMALTSPPYFDVEKYDGEETSTKVFPKYELWKDGFYLPLIRNTMQALRKGGVFCLQVGSQKYPLAKDAMEIASLLGYKAKIAQSGILKDANIYETEEERGEQLVLIEK